MRPIFGFSSSAARSRMDDALAPLLGASPESGPPGSPNLSPRVSGRASVVVDCGALAHPTVATIDQLAGLHLAVRRNGGRLELAGARPSLLELIDFCGLAGSLGVEAGRQAEERKQPGGVEEEGELPDPAA
jgi:hypothetical protein